MRHYGFGYPTRAQGKSRSNEFDARMRRMNSRVASSTTAVFAKNKIGPKSW